MRQEPAHRVRDCQRGGEHTRPTEIPRHDGRTNRKEQRELVGAHRAQERCHRADDAGQGSDDAQATLKSQHQAGRRPGEGQAAHDLGDVHQVGVPSTRRPHHPDDIPDQRDAPPTTPRMARIPRIRAPVEGCRSSSGPPRPLDIRQLTSAGMPNRRRRNISPSRERGRAPDSAPPRAGTTGRPRPRPDGRCAGARAFRAYRGRPTRATMPETGEAFMTAGSRPSGGAAVRARLPWPVQARPRPPG